MGLAGACTTSSCSEGAALIATCAFEPEPVTLLATVTPTSNRSPGATNVGTPGVMTNGPRMMDSVSAEPTALPEIATAITFRLPLK